MAAAGFLTIAFFILYNADLGGTQLNDPVPFPPAPPNDSNIRAICGYANQRPRYHPSSSWSSHFHRRAKAMNLLESWYQLCCGRGLDQPGTMICAVTAWKEALSQFCVEETSVKTAVYECCRPNKDKWQCFSTDTFNPSYGPVMG